MIIASCSGRILAYDRATGEPRWEVDASFGGEPRAFHGEMALTDHGVVVVGSDPHDGSVRAIKVEDGRVLWTWPSVAGTSSDLLVIDQSVYAVTLDHRVVALSMIDGSEIWTAPAVPELDRVLGTSSPVRWGEAVLVARADGTLTRFDLHAGTPKVLTRFEAAPSTDLSRHGDRGWLGLEDGRVVLLEGATGEIVAERQLEDVARYRWIHVAPDGGAALWVGHTGLEGPGRRLLALDAGTLEVRWQQKPPGETNAWTTAQPAWLEGWILAGDREGFVRAHDARSGEPVWELSIDQPPRVIHPLGEELWVGTYDGQLVALRAADTP